MKNILVVVDMQKDFIDGALGTKEKWYIQEIRILTTILKRRREKICRLCTV